MFGRHRGVLSLLVLIYIYSLAATNELADKMVHLHNTFLVMEKLVEYYHYFGGLTNFVPNLFLSCCNQISSNLFWGIITS